MTDLRCGDCLEVLRAMPAQSVHCCVTSPPYWGLRDYGVEGQLGLESTPAQYVERMTEVLAEVRRVLRDDGTLWLNLGDSYTAGGSNRNGIGSDDPKWGGDNTKKTAKHSKRLTVGVSTGLAPKQLCGIPWRVAFALQADGWYLRSDVIWAKPNPMPESVTDRPTKAHEYVFLLSKRERYYYDAEAIKEEGSGVGGGSCFGKQSQDVTGTLAQSRTFERPDYATRNRRSVWTITTQPYPEAHFATFPEDLVEPCIKAGTSEKGCCPECGAPWERIVERSPQMPCIANAGDDLEPLRASNNDADRRRQLSGAKQAAWKTANPDRHLGWQPTCDHDQNDANCAAAVVLDPFAGSGTTLLVARKLGRRGIGIELNPKYIDLARKRIDAYAPLFGLTA